jgi:hypothetical protein
VGSERVLRTDLFLRFRPTATDSARLAFFSRTGARATAQTPAGSFWAQFPDPGPAGFQRMLDSLEKIPELRAVYPHCSACRSTCGPGYATRAGSRLPGFTCARGFLSSSGSGPRCAGRSTRAGSP